MSKRQQEAPRRRKGEGGIDRVHSAATGCPPAQRVVGEDGKERSVVPPHKCAGRYRARVWVTTTTGERVRKGVYGMTEREVISKLKRLTVDEATGQVVRNSTTVKDWLRTDEGAFNNFWTRGTRPGPKQWKASTRAGYHSRVNRHLIPYLGHHRLDRLTKTHVENMYADMRAKGLTEPTIRAAHLVLQRALEVAMKEGKVASNVCRAVEAPSAKPKTPPRALTVKEAWQVLRMAGDDPRYWLALLTGMRQGEALALRWFDLHLEPEEDGDMPYLLVRESVSKDEGRNFVYGDPKSEASTGRRVPLVTPLADRLRRAQVAHLESGGSLDALVFPHPRTGAPMDSKRDWTGWATLLALAGVPHVRLHNARKTTTHLLENAGVPDRVVKEIVGHAQVSMTHYYQRGNEPAIVDAMRALDAYLERTQPPALRAV